MIVIKSLCLIIIYGCVWSKINIHKYVGNVETLFLGFGGFSGVAEEKNWGLWNYLSFSEGKRWKKHI
jgi:hypothetical protein